MPLEDRPNSSQAPGAADGSEPQDQAPLAQGPADPKATVLVVDDEAAVRRVLVMRLQLAGSRVICAEDGEEALTLFHQ